MSGTDYTTTPNLALFKPISNRAIGTWGDLWNSNADTLDATMAHLSGGPFLPLTGGTVSGPTMFTGGYSAASANPWLYSAINVFGAVPTGQQANWHAFNIGSDSVDASLAQGKGATGTYLGHNITAGAVGGRTSFNVSLYQTGPTTTTLSEYYVALGAFAQASATAGGTSGSKLGALFAANFGVMIEPGAHNWLGPCGLEIDIGVAAGETAQFKNGLTIIQYATDAVRGIQADAAFEICNQGGGTAPGWTTGIAFGGPTGWWPFTTTSTLIGTLPCSSGGPPVAALSGIDFTAIAFSGNAFASTGFSVGNDGHVRTDRGYSSGSHLATTPGDLSHHLDLYNTQFGINITTDGNTNYTASTGHVFYNGATDLGRINATGLNGMGIGQSTPAAGAFTNLAATGTVSGAGFTALVAPYATSASVSATYLPLAGGSLSGGLHFGAVVAPGGATDLSRHIELYSGYAGFNVTSNQLNYVIAGGAAHVFYIGSTSIASVYSTGVFANVGLALGVGGSSGPTWTTGSGVPSSTQPVGSLYSRVSTWAAGATLYVSKGAGAWTAVASV